MMLFSIKESTDTNDGFEGDFFETRSAAASPELLSNMLPAPAEPTIGTL